MKADNSSSNTASSLLKIRIPKFHQLSPIEIVRTDTRLSNQYTTESTNKSSSLLSSDDSSEGDFHPIDLSLRTMHKTTPLSSLSSNIKTESNELSTPLKACSKNEIKSKPIKKCTNFTIDHLLSSSCRTSNNSNPSKQITSIFSKKKTRHFSDNYLHQIINRQRISKHKCLQAKSSNPPRTLFVRYILEIFNDLINRKNQIKNPTNSSTIDPLEQLAELACKLDRRQQAMQLNEDLILKQCYLLIRQVYQKYQYKKIRKRLNANGKYAFKKRFLQFLLSILNNLQMKKIDLLSTTNLVDYHLLTSDINSDKFKEKTNKSISSICFYLKPEEIRTNLEVLVPNHGLLYEAIVQIIETFDDLLLVRVNHDRQNYLIPKHDLCRIACPKMIPNDFNSLFKSLRVCAYWSASLRGLHPGTINKVPLDTDQSSMVSLIFDDGDSGLIKLDEIRLLPDNYQLKDINLEEWRISSFQISSLFSTNSQRTSRRSFSCASTNHRNSSVKRINTRPKSSTIVPQWTLNSQNSTICRHDKKQTIHAGDCVVLHGVDQSLSYIGKVLKFYHNKSTKLDMARLKWYYSPKETSIGIQDNDLPGALYESTHIDENPISTIRSKGTIFESYEDYIKKTKYGQKRKDTDFYLVGHYNPTTGKLRRYSNK